MSREELNMVVSTECPFCNGIGEVIGATPSVRSRYVRRDDLNPGDFAETCRNCGGSGVVDRLACAGKDKSDAD